MGKRIAVLIAAVFAAAALAGCAKSNLAVRVNGEDTAEIEAVRAPKGYFGAGGSLEAGEGEKIVIDAEAWKKGEIIVKFADISAPGIDADAEELAAAADPDGPALELTIAPGAGTAEYEIAPGSYVISSEVLKKADGLVRISVR